MCFAFLLKTYLNARVKDCLPDIPENQIIIQFARSCLSDGAHSIPDIDCGKNAYSRVQTVIQRPKLLSFT